MKTYVGTKTIKATPMNRLAYNEYRGWKLPEDENGEDEGMLVEYLDGGKSNHPNHVGYISWSPLDVFEKAYKLAETPLDRLLIEQEELFEKFKKLHNFLNSEKISAYDLVGKFQYEMLFMQLNTMKTYLSILKLIIDDLKQKQ